MDRLLDGKCMGPLFLRDPAVAKIVTDAIFYRDLRAFQLHAFVVMPNHWRKNLKAHCSSFNDSTGGRFQGDAISQEVHSQASKPYVATDRPTILTG